MYIPIRFSKQYKIALKGLPQEAIKHLKLIFSDLSDDNLLRKCLHGKTQNQNESFNGFISRRIPKDRFVKMTTFELAVYDAVAHFNIDNLATVLLFDKVNIERGYCTTLECITECTLECTRCTLECSKCTKWTFKI